jgi:hypothetical protein
MYPPDDRPDTLTWAGSTASCGNVAAHELPAQNNAATLPAARE